MRRIGTPTCLQQVLKVARATGRSPPSCNQKYANHGGRNERSCRSRLTGHIDPIQPYCASL
jgi:hypothetical protein